MKDFDCRRCERESGQLMPIRMYVCPHCGDKRCPKAEDHRASCDRAPAVDVRVTTPDGKEIASWSRDAQGRLVDDPRPSVGPTYSEMVEDKLDASLVATRLVQRSAWFECTPYPDDVWQFVVKFDQKETLRDAIEHVRTT